MNFNESTLNISLTRIIITLWAIKCVYISIYGLLSKINEANEKERNE